MAFNIFKKKDGENPLNEIDKEDQKKLLDYLLANANNDTQEDIDFNQVPIINISEEENLINFKEIEAAFDQPNNCPFIEHCPLIVMESLNISGKDATFEYDLLPEDHPLRQAYDIGYDMGWDAYKDEMDVIDPKDEKELGDMVDDAFEHIKSICDQHPPLDTNPDPSISTPTEIQQTKLDSKEYADIAYPLPKLHVLSPIEDELKEVLESDINLDKEEEMPKKENVVIEHAFKVRSITPISQPLKEKEIEEATKEKSKDGLKKIKSTIYKDKKIITTYTDGTTYESDNIYC